MKIIVIGGFAPSLLNFRGPMMQSMVAHGHRVIAMAPKEESAGILPKLAALGVEFETIPLDRTGLNPVADLAALRSLTQVLRRHRVDAVLSYTAKAVVYGSIAAWLARIPLRVAMITGAGSVLQPPGTPRQWLAHRVLRALYGFALRRANLVFFQNPDDEALFRKLGMVAARQRVHRINGSGVDLAQFPLTSLPAGPPVFLLSGRLIRDKGILEYVEAARIVRRVRPAARFKLLGMFDKNPSAIQPAQIEAWAAEGVIEYLGTATDVRPHIAAAHVCVLPSYFEGVPRSILEGMAMGRPIIVTDAPGCRETVVDGINGALVPIKNPAALAQAMMRMIDEQAKLQAMGTASRAIAEERFAMHRVNHEILQAMDLLGD